MMNSAYDERGYSVRLWTQLQLAAERERLIDGFKQLPKAEQEQYAHWIDMLENYPEDYARLKRDMSRVGISIRDLLKALYAPKDVRGVRGVVIRLIPKTASWSKVGAKSEYADELPMAVGFSTKDESTLPDPWFGRGELSGDVVEVLVGPDPHGKRIQIRVWIDEPKSTSPGACLSMTASGEDAANAALAKIELKAIGSRIQGEASVAMPWKEFVVLAKGGDFLLTPEAISKA